MSKKSKNYETIVNSANTAKDIANSVDAMAVIKDAIDYFQTAEKEATKREYIRNQRDTIVRALEYEKDVLLAYFDRRFDEREASLDRLFNVLDRAVDEGDHKVLDKAVDGIIGVLNENPLKDLKTFKDNMSDPNFQLEL